MNITCIITDDEPIARQGLESYIRKIPFLELVGVCEDALQLSSLLQEKKADLLFLDIEMPALSGIDLVRSLARPPKVVFTTAYEQYALQGFELDVLDYLLKPISFDRFLKAAHKAADYFSARSTPAEYMFIKVDGRLEKILFGEIVWVQALENYVAIHTETKKWITHATLKSVQQALPSYFVQTHKSWLVNARRVTAIEGSQVRCGAAAVPVSKYLRQAVLQAVTRGRLLNKGGDEG